MYPPKKIQSILREKLSTFLCRILIFENNLFTSKTYIQFFARIFFGQQILEHPVYANILGSTQICMCVMRLHLGFPAFAPLYDLDDFQKNCERPRVGAAALYICTATHRAQHASSGAKIDKREVGARKRDKRANASSAEGKKADIVISSRFAFHWSSK